jgi:hypothetical protein
MVKTMRSRSSSLAGGGEAVGPVPPALALDEAARRQLGDLQARVEALWDELATPEPDRQSLASKHFLGAQGLDPAAARRALLSEYLGLLRHREATLHVLRCIAERERCLAYLAAMFERFRRRRKVRQLQGLARSNASGSRRRSCCPPAQMFT